MRVSRRRPFFVYGGYSVVDSTKRQFGIMSNESSNTIGLVLALAFDDSLNLEIERGDLF
jgi:hypothetical protein